MNHDEFIIISCVQNYTTLLKILAYLVSLIPLLEGFACAIMSSRGSSFIESIEKECSET